MSRMTSAMEAVVRAVTSRVLADASTKFRTALDRPVAQPMADLSHNVTFRVTRPGDGARRFTVSVTLTEATLGAGAVTTGYDF